MPKKQPPEIIALRASLLRVVGTCPVAIATPAECPLCALAKIPPAIREPWLYSLGESQVWHLASYHSLCTKLKCGLSQPLTAPNPQPTNPTRKSGEKNRDLNV